MIDNRFHLIHGIFFLFLFFIAGGKPITPNDVTDSLSNGHAVENGAVNESVTKTEVRTIDSIVGFISI